MPSSRLLVTILGLTSSFCRAQQPMPQNPQPQSSQAQQPAESQINVNWLYGSYIPKEVPRKALTRRERVQLYVRQTYMTPGIYAKTMIFALYDQMADSNPQWGDGFGGFAKRFGSQHAQFVIQNSVSSLGNGLLGLEPRYDRCHCERFWPRMRYAVWRNFVTYDRTETALRPQIMPYLGAFGASAVATTWQPGNPVWQVRGYQGAITQIFVGTGVNVLSEFAPEILRILHREKADASNSAAGNSP